MLGYFAEKSETLTLRHTWSLSVEEQFYLVFPLFIALVLWGNRRRLRVLVGSLLIVSTLSFAALVVMGHAESLPFLHRPGSAAYYFPITRVWEMAAGVALAIWHLSRPPLGPRAARWVGGAGGAGFVAAVVLFTADAQSSSPALALPVASTALVLAACRSPGPLTRVLSWAPLCWVGDRSYGWYLWHWPLIVLARMEWPNNRLALISAALLALGVSTVTHRWVEAPFRYPRRELTERQHTRSGLRVAGVCLAASALAMGSLNVAAAHYWGSPTIRSMAAQVLPRPLVLGPEACPMDEVLRSGDLSACIVGEGTKDPIYLVGDSNAGQFGAGLLVAGDRLSTAR